MDTWVFIFRGALRPPGSSFAGPSPEAVAPRADALRSGRDSEDAPHADVHAVCVNARSGGGSSGGCWQPPGGEGRKFPHWFRSEPRSQHKINTTTPASLLTNRDPTQTKPRYLTPPPLASSRDRDL